MDLNFKKNDKTNKNLSKKSIVPLKCKSFTDISTMEEEVSFSMIVDKNPKNDTFDETNKTLSQILPDISTHIPRSKSMSIKYSNISHNSEHNPSRSMELIGEFGNDSDSYSDTEDSYGGGGDNSGDNNDNNNNNNTDTYDTYDTYDTTDTSDFNDAIDRMITAETPPDPFMSIQTRSRLRWIDDGNAHRCGICNKQFRIFLRRHHCIVEGTPITMMNGMAKKIENVSPNHSIPSWDNTSTNITKGHNDALLDQGYESCLKLKLEDGRELIATSDHEVLVTNDNNGGIYIQMKNLTPDHRVICSVLDGVLDDPELDNIDYIIPGTNFSILNDRDKCLAFARLCGYSLVEGSVDRKFNRIVFIMGICYDDVYSIVEDIELLIGSGKIDIPKHTSTRTLYKIECKSRKIKKWFHDAGVTVGNNTNQGMKIPTFMLDNNCPKSIQREFVAGWFGGHGKFSSDPLISEPNPLISEPNPLISNHINKVANSFGIETTDVVKFNKYIGFRYNINKQIEMTIKSTYINYNNQSNNTNNNLSFDQFKNKIGWNKGETIKRYFTLQVLEPPTIYDNGKPQHVYDLSVPNYVSFVANGMIVHNCRLCGDVFCATCSDNWESIPECITHIPSSSGLKTEIDRTQEVRLCDKCDEKISLVKKLEILLKSAQSVVMDIFAFKAIGEQKSGELTDSFIQKVNDIPDMEDMGDTELINFTQSFMNGKLWKQLANFYLSKFREIQYKLSYQDYTEWERNALWTNYKHMKGHDIWMVHVIKAFMDDRDRLGAIIDFYFEPDKSDRSDTPDSDTPDQTDNPKDQPTDNPFSDIKVKDTDACWERMCTRLCQPALTWESSIMLFDVIRTKYKTFDNRPDKIRDKLTIQIVKAVNQVNDDILENIMPCITYHLIYDDLNEILVNFVMTRCSKSIKITNHVYWALTLEKVDNKKRCDYLITRLFREIPTDIYDDITKVNNFVTTIEDNFQGDTNPEIPIKDLDEIGLCVSPTHPDLGEQLVTPTVLPGEKSANRPVPIVLIHSDDMTNTKNVELYKREDLRTDMIVMSIIRIMHEILKDTMEIDLHVVTYNIQPTSKDSGFIGAVNNCDTLYTIEEDMKISLANYVKKNNPETPNKELTQRFIRSCAFYSVVTFLLGIGDRHLDNIMLTKRGEIFHIDYGFILGKDPRPMKSPYMRITKGMLDAIGGYHSDEYGEFKELCYDIYDTLRRHVNTFVSLLSLLPKQNIGGTWTNPKISDNRVLREIVKRFAPGENYQQAKTILHTKIEKSTNMTNRSKYHIVDFFHRHNKEGTISNVLSYTVGSTLSGTRYLLHGVWNYVSSSLV